MKDGDCVAFLQWALPQLQMRWPGYRKVRRQVCKRINRRMRALGLPDIHAYRAHLATEPSEWSALDSLCRITISRFYRDRAVFELLRTTIVPVLARDAIARGDDMLSCWSAGCARGEEAYTLSVLWQTELRASFPGIAVEIVATDADAAMLSGARLARYGETSLRDLPATWQRAAFERGGRDFQLRKQFRDGLKFRRQDIRQVMPRGPFHLVFCRNLVFTYYDDGLQRRLYERLTRRIVSGGFLVIGQRESLPNGVIGLAPYAASLGVYRRTSVAHGTVRRIRHASVIGPGVEG